MVLWLLAQAASLPATNSPNLVELAQIVEPYARCEFSREPRYKKLQDEWSEATKKSYADPTDATAAKESARLMDGLRLAKLQTQEVCGFERTHQELRNRLKALNPQMDESRAFWLARAVFANLNNLNDTIVKFGAGVFPPSPFAPPR